MVMDVAITSKVLSSSWEPQMRCQKNPFLESKNLNDELGEFVCLSSFFFILPLHNTLCWRVGNADFYVPTCCVCTCVCEQSSPSHPRNQWLVLICWQALSQVLGPLEIIIQFLRLGPWPAIPVNITTIATPWPSQTLSPAPPLHLHCPTHPLPKPVSLPLPAPPPHHFQYLFPCHHHHHQHHLPSSPVTSTTIQSLYQQTLIGHLLCARHCCRHWGYITEQNKQCPFGAYILRGGKAGNLISHKHNK